MIDSKGIIHISPSTVNFVEDEDFGTDVYCGGTDHDRITAEYWRTCARTVNPPHVYRESETHEGDYVLGSVLEDKKISLIMGIGSEIVKGIDDPKIRSEALYYLSSRLESMYEVVVYLVGRCVKMEQVVSQTDNDTLVVSRKLKSHETKIVDPRLNQDVAVAEFGLYRQANRELFSMVSRLAIANHETLDHYREGHFSRHVNPDSEEVMNRDVNYHILNHAYKQALYVMLKTCSITMVESDLHSEVS